MKFTEALKNIYHGLGHSINRFPLTIVLLVISAVLNSLMIENTQLDFERFAYTLLVGALLGAVGQLIYERFFTQPLARYLLMFGTLLLTVGYYFLINVTSGYDTIFMTKTSVISLALALAFIWIPTINNAVVLFHQNFLAAFKAFFITIMFTGVLTLGISAIFYATDYLLFNINNNILSHLLNYLGILFAPMYFLSMTPRYETEVVNLHTEDADATQPILLRTEFSVPRFLEILISYIVIPLIMIYTLILLAYVVINFTEDFWTDNLLEPLLVSYAVVVIVVLILSYNIDNRFAVLFRKVFPKILLPIVIFQTIASVLKIQEMGITHGRYYVIMFGLFATIAGILFSFLQPKYHGWLVAVLLVLSFISIVPPVDAFTVSKNMQLNLLEERLIENDMLENNQIVPNSNVPEEDRIVITQAVTYIDQMGYTEEVNFLPAGLEVYNNFNQIFGFNLTYPDQSVTEFFGEYAFLNEAEEVFIMAVDGFDIMLTQYLYHTFGESSDELERVNFVVADNRYTIEDELVDDYQVLIISDEEDNALIRFETEEIFNQIFEVNNENADIYLPLTLEDATFTFENEQVRMQVVVIAAERTPETYSINFHWFIDIKE